MTSLPAKKLLLVEPPFFRLYCDSYSLDRAPLSLGYLGCTAKEKAGWDVMIYNVDFKPNSKIISVSHLAGKGFDNYLENLQDPSYCVWEEARRTIAEFKPTVMGITCKSQNFTAARKLAQIAKEVDSSITVVVGGPHPSMVGADVLSDDNIDIAAQGEGENTLVELLQWKEGKRELENIHGIIYRSDTEIIKNSPREYIQDLDTLCHPHKNLSSMLKDHDQFPLVAFRGIFATRGCPFNCSFCGSKYIWTRKVRYRSVDNVLEEIRDLLSKGIPSIHFEDDTFGINKKYIRDLCSGIKREFPSLEWSCEINVRLVNDEVVSMMTGAGCHRILIGIESGNDHILETIRKNITIEQAYEACRIIRRHGAKLSTFFMIGFPHETEETLDDTIEAIKQVFKLGGDVVYSIFTPYPGTELFQFCKEKGLVTDDFNVSLYNHQSPMNCFSMYIKPERFREKASEIEKIVDRMNRRAWLKRAFSLSTLKRIREIGLLSAFKRGLQLIGFK